jgi:hypothetical protein
MSLNWNVSKIHDYENVCWVKKEDGSEVLNGATNCLIWSTMAVGLGEISENNLEEWLWRLEFLKGVGRTEPNLCDLDLLEQHIGLKCNVIDEPRGKWSNRIIKTFKQDIDYKVRRAMWENRGREKEEKRGNH